MCPSTNLLYSQSKPSDRMQLTSKKRKREPHRSDHKFLHMPLWGAGQTHHHPLLHWTSNNSRGLRLVKCTKDSNQRWSVTIDQLLSNKIYSETHQDCALNHQRYGISRDRYLVQTNHSTWQVSNLALNHFAWVFHRITLLPTANQKRSLSMRSSSTWSSAKYLSLISKESLILL